jgi:ABC-type bacteriocin/lantibiotic exporter with double-glycine peptidase domain
MRDLSKMTDTVSKAGVGFERIARCWKRRRSPRSAARPPRPRFKGKIEFDKVTFGYTPTS